MTDEELLKIAEAYIENFTGKSGMGECQALAQMSLACSQLVIARNSVRVEVDVPEQADLAKLRMPL